MAAPRFGPPGLAQVTSWAALWISKSTSIKSSWGVPPSQRGVLVLMYGVIAMSRGIEPLDPDDMAL
jgi:hypothetical protein